MSDKTLYLVAGLMTLIAQALIFSKKGEEIAKERGEIALNEGYLRATKTFQARCEDDGFVVLNETLYRCSKAAEVPGIDFELGE